MGIRLRRKMMMMMIAKQGVTDSHGDGIFRIFFWILSREEGGSRYKTMKSRGIDFFVESFLQTMATSK